jgi:hypothetical protein
MAAIADASGLPVPPRGLFGLERWMDVFSVPFGHV